MQRKPSVPQHQLMPNPTPYYCKEIAQNKIRQPLINSKRIKRSKEPTLDNIIKLSRIRRNKKLRDK
jgi:hypothetical protein